MEELYRQEKLLIRPPEHSCNPTRSHLVAKQEELTKEITNFVLRNIFVHTSKGSLTCRNILRHAASLKMGRVLIKINLLAQLKVRNLLTN
jgi:hypothetical protein